ncbi:MAG TPA: hypothetical protein VKR83_07685 [Ktedonobacteraceae bacterium]|nr:hypothetical protein [Ktedonobacteraceae bacterium]
MKHFLKWKLILPFLPLFIMVGAIVGPLAGNFMSIYAAGTTGTQDIALAKSILSNSNIVLAKSHPNGMTDRVYCTGTVDHATAYCNIIELANGQKAARSSYYDPAQGHSGPGGSTTVQPLLLQIILAAAASGQQVGVMEIAGGVHPAHPAHYTGHAVDFSMFNGQQVTGRNQPSIELIQTILSLLPPGSAIGQSQCGQTPPLLAKAFQTHHILTIPDSCGHVHIQIP